MDTMGQLLKENYDPLKRIFGVWGQTLRTSYSSQCSSFYLCHWQRYVTFNMWVTRVTTVVTIVQGFFWSQWCQNIVGHNRARISLETIVPSGPRPQPCGGPRVRKGSLTGGRPTWWRWTSWGCWGTAGCLELSSDAMLVGTGDLGIRSKFQILYILT